MQESTWQRFSALGGVLFVVLSVIGTVTQGTPPASDGDAAEFVDWFADNVNGIVAQQWLGGLSVVLLLWFASTLWRRMADAEDGSRLAVLSMLGLVVGLTTFLIGTAVLAATAHRIDEIGGGARPLYFLAAMLTATAGFGIGLHLLATGTHAFRTGIMPRWVAIVAIVNGVVFLAGGIGGTATDQDSGYLIGFLGYIVWSVWVLIVSGLMWRDQLGAAMTG